MATLNRDFRFKGQVPSAAIIQAFRNQSSDATRLQQQQQQIELAKKKQRQDQLLDLINVGSKLSAAMVESSRERTKKENRNIFAELLGSRDDLIETGERKPAGVGPFNIGPTGQAGPGFGPVSELVLDAKGQPVTGKREDVEPGFAGKLEAAGLRAFPKAGKKIVENLFAGSAGASEADLLKLQRLKLQVKKLGEEQDPNSIVATTARRELKERGITKEQMEGQSPNELKKAAELLQKGEKTTSFKIRGEVSLKGLRQRTMKDLLPGFASSGSLMGKNLITLRAAEQTGALIQQTRGKPISQQRTEIAIGVAQTVQRGTVVSEKIIAKMDPTTGVTTITELYQWITNKATPADLTSFMTIFGETVIREGALSDMNIKQVQIDALKTSQVFTTKNEKESMRKTLGIPLSAWKRGRINLEDLAEEDFKSTLPNFNPGTLTSSELLTGSGLTPVGILREEEETRERKATLPSKFNKALQRKIESLERSIQRRLDAGEDDDFGFEGEEGEF